MGKVKSAVSHDSSTSMIPSINPEVHEKQMVSLAMEVAERQMREGTASSQVITHFLKIGSQKEKLERERLKEENNLLRAKVEALQSQANIEKLYSNAIAAMTEYSGKQSEEEEYYDY